MPYQRTLKVMLYLVCFVPYKMCLLTQSHERLRDFIDVACLNPVTLTETETKVKYSTVLWL